MCACVYVCTGNAANVFLILGLGRKKFKKHCNRPRLYHQVKYLPAGHIQNHNSGCHYISADPLGFRRFELTPVKWDTICSSKETHVNVEGECSC